MDTTDTNLADLIREGRDRAGLSQEDLADRMGVVSQQWVTKIETGRVKQPRVAHLRRAAEVLGLSLADLVLAAGLAESPSAARRVADAVDVDYDPFRDVVFRGYEGLTEEGRRFIAQQIKIAQESFGREQRGDDATEDGPDAGGDHS